MSDNKMFIVENVAIVSAQDTASLVKPNIKIEDFLKFTGDLNETVQLRIALSKAVEEKTEMDIIDLFGSWVESGEEDKQLEDLYRSRRLPSALTSE